MTSRLYRSGRSSTDTRSSSNQTDHANTYVPAHRFLRFEWGDDVVTDFLSRTRLAFSRRNTEAAQALREQVSGRLDF
jgi:hypothetical protein